MEVPCKVCFDAHGLEKEEMFFGFCGLFTVFVCLDLFVFLFVCIYLFFCLFAFICFFVCLDLFVFLFVCLSFVCRAWALSHTMPS